MRWRPAFLLFILSLLVAGCGPEVSKEELGTITSGIPKVAGADKPYQMPQLGPPLEDEDGGHH